MITGEEAELFEEANSKLSKWLSIFPALSAKNADKGGPPAVPFHLRRQGIQDLSRTAVPK